MFMDKVIKHKNDIFMIVGYMVVTAIIGTILNDGLVLFLTINMFLAGVAWGISVIIEMLDEHHAKKWVIIILTIVWVLFFPNLIYITTDFVHLQNYQFFEIYAQSYMFIFSDWLVFFIIFVGAMISANLGVKSIKKILNVWHIDQSIKYIYLLVLFIVSSIGIYIGRFIRLNSWDFYRLDIIFNGIFSRFTFFLGFIFIFTIIHFIYFAIFNKNEK